MILLDEPITTPPADLIQRFIAIVAEQAEDEGLWFKAHTAPEAYLQRALRRLHEAIEGKTSEECAREVTHEP